MKGADRSEKAQSLSSSPSSSTKRSRRKLSMRSWSSFRAPSLSRVRQRSTLAIGVPDRMPSLSEEAIMSFCFKGPALQFEPSAFPFESEVDDCLHDPGFSKEHKKLRRISKKMRGISNVGSIIMLLCVIVILFAGFPILSAIDRATTIHREKAGFGLGDTNATGQLPFVVGLRALIDEDTPDDARSRMSLDGKKRMNLVFSDEFNKDGRSFYPGDDPYWEAADLHYWGTGNYEWYDPAAVTTKEGFLEITLSETPTHNLNFRGGMLTSWNKMCFTGGLIEVRVILPGPPNVSGLWPAAWTMGNLGRAGYGATLDGLWPYSYDTCDVGTLPNQTFPAWMGGGPLAAETTGIFVQQFGPTLSYLPGQRLSRCTCPNFPDHPGPKLPDGTWKGRASPELDIFEAAAGMGADGIGRASMSLQTAPFDAHYDISHAPGTFQMLDPMRAQLNVYTGSVNQQAMSGVVTVDSTAYEKTQAEPTTFGYEYTPGGSPDSHITWTQGGEPMWRLNSAAIGPNARTQIGQRLIPEEPMYVILNLGISAHFIYVDFANLQFPAKMRVDYVRIWQPEGEENIGCDPPDHPTSDYIKRHWEAYTNPNLTTWMDTPSKGGYGQPRVPNSIVDTCT